MKHPRTENHSHHEEEGYSRVENVADDVKEPRLTDCTGECEDIADEVEFLHL